MSDRYRPATEALSEVAMPVVVVGAARGNERSCATATVMYVSLDPPEVAIALHPGSRTGRLLRETGEFSVSILSDGQVDVATRAGRSATGPDKFLAADIALVDPPAGFSSPGVAGSVAVLWCRVTKTLETGDHVLMIGSVAHHVTLDPAGRPLLRDARRYAALGAWLSDVAAEYPI
jgi:flavin reductase (DIM6/NTAB) family NADH-FMN oxidoreductase RutF